MNHSNNQYDKWAPRVWQWYSHVGTNQKLSNWTQYFFNINEIILVTGKPSRIPKVSEVIDLGGESTTASLAKLAQLVIRF